MKELRITPSPEFMGFGYNVRLIDKDNRAYATGVTMQTVTEETFGQVIPPLVTLDKLEVQAVMDELWKAGIRPSNGAGDATAFESVKYHLEDMRRLVFKGKP